MTQPFGEENDVRGMALSMLQDTQEKLTIVFALFEAYSILGDPADMQIQGVIDEFQSGIYYALESEVKRLLSE